jgi:hypothetical protein
VPARVLALAAAPLIALGGLAAAPAAHAATCTAGFPAQPVNPGTFSNKLAGVTVLSQCDAWVVGNFQGGTSTSLAEHWNGRTWKVFPVPFGGGTQHDNFLNAVAATSGTDAWAVGLYNGGTVFGAYQTLIVHWDGTSWTQVPSRNPGGSGQPNRLFAVAATSRSNAWAVGNYSDGTADQALIEHWDGRRWHTVPSPDPGGPGRDNELFGVTATSGSSAWAVGDYFDGTITRPLIEHWNGTSWQTAKSPGLDNDLGNVLTSVSASSGSNAWAVGHVVDSFSQSHVPLTEHWDGTAWKVVKSAGPGGFSSVDLRGVAATSRGNAWAVGTVTLTEGTPGQTFIEHWDGTRWQAQPSDNPGGSSSDDELAAVAASSRSNAWSVGSSGGAQATLALHCC